MNIDCPHCGVLGSVDESLADKKLRCPECRKVFLVPGEFLPEGESVEDVPLDMVSDDAPPGLMDEGFDDDSEPSEEIAFLEEAEDSEEESLGILEEEADSEDQEEDLLEVAEETEDDALTADSTESSTKDDELAESVVDVRSDEEGDNLEIALEEEQDTDPGELEECSGCGESLHPDFLETVGEKRYCALCAPEELDDSEEIADSPSVEDAESLDAALMGDESSDEEATDTDENEQDASKEPCSVCGENFHPDFLQEKDSRLYCELCRQEESDEEMAVDGSIVAAAGAGAAMLTGAAATEGGGEETAAELSPRNVDFTVGDLIKEAWLKTKGVKGSIWGATLVMYLIIFGIGFGGMAAFDAFYQGTDQTAYLCFNGILQLFTTWLSMILTAGIMLIGVRHVLEQRVSWKMVFAGFSRTLSITIAMIVQTILILIGFMLLVVPGIYLSIGYALTLPLILNKGMGPWEALEASRKAIHKKWWKVFGLYLVMILLYAVSIIPLGIGLIWTVPMFFVLIGVLYVQLFGVSGVVEDDSEGDNGKDE